MIGERWIGLENLKELILDLFVIYCVGLRIFSPFQLERFAFLNWAVWNRRNAGFHGESDKLLLDSIYSKLAFKIMLKLLG